MNPQNFGPIISYILVGLGVFSAGIGILRAGVAIGRTADKTINAVIEHGESARRIAGATERQAVALEGSQGMVPLLESLHEDRVRINEELQGLHATLRVQSRKLNAALGDYGKENPDA